jgi:hypothetical protein
MNATRVKGQDRDDEPVTEAVLVEASARGRKRPGLQPMRVQYLPALGALLAGFVDQSAVLLPVKNYPELAALSQAELEQMTLGFRGSALCLDARDLHVSIVGLVSASQPLMALAAARMAQK